MIYCVEKVLKPYISSIFLRVHTEQEPFKIVYSLSLWLSIHFVNFMDILLWKKNKNLSITQSLFWRCYLRGWFKMRLIRIRFLVNWKFILNNVSDSNCVFSCFRVIRQPLIIIFAHHYFGWTYPITVFLDEGIKNYFVNVDYLKCFSSM